MEICRLESVLFSTSQTVHTTHRRDRDSARRSNFNPFESWAVFGKSSIRYRRPSGHVMEPERLIALVGTFIYM